GFTGVFQRRRERDPSGRGSEKRGERANGQDDGRQDKPDAQANQPCETNAFRTIGACRKLPARPKRLAPGCNCFPFAQVVLLTLRAVPRTPDAPASVRRAAAPARGP